MAELQDYYSILGVEYSATQEEIEDAYHQLARKLHPDMTGEDPELTARYMAVNEAYQTLSRKEARKEYDESIGVERTEGTEEGKAEVKKKVRKKSDTTPAQDMRLLDAKMKRAVKQANKLCKKGNFWQADRILQKYMKTHSDNVTLRKALAKAALGRKRYHEAVNHMKAVCKIQYHNPDNYVELAAIYVEAGQLVLAEKALHEAFGWNKEHPGALQLKKKIEELRDADKPPIQRLFRKISKALKR
ncbi:MAG: DnaJ domain-containing protein [Candidatus Aegiribacteria sp.]|nr:DnaJ domain-containing protein [Candidatus Aegiribacteria sp.]MBD3294503.1 DnaJ domain-containing protein [Candidatus Fermentibacteria bacterium]